MLGPNPCMGYALGPMGIAIGPWGPGWPDGGPGGVKALTNVLSCGASGSFGSGGTGGRHGLGTTIGCTGMYATGPSRPLRPAMTDIAPGGMPVVPPGGGTTAMPLAFRRLSEGMNLSGEVSTSLSSALDTAGSPMPRNGLAVGSVAPVPDLLTLRAPSPAVATCSGRAGCADVGGVTMDNVFSEALGMVATLISSCAPIRG